MSRTPRDNIARQFDRIERKIEAGEIDPETYDILQEYADTLDKAKPHQTATDVNGRTFSCSPSTVEAYVRCCRIMAEAGVNPLYSDAADVNAYMEERHDGGRGLSQNTLIIYQSALR